MVMGMQIQPAGQQFNPEQLAVIKATVAKGTTNDEFKLFIEVCKYHALNPFARQIYAVVRVSQKDGSRNLCIQTSIDGYRLLAERSGKYAGQMGPQWCGEDGQWVDVWLSSKPPAAARIGILRKDFQQPVWGIAKYASYAQDNPIWRKMPDNMLAKCAESLALRKAFPAEMSGIYTKEEMDQADGDLPTVDHSAHAVESTPSQSAPTETPQEPTVDKAAQAMQGIQAAVAFQKERAYNEKLIQNEEQWQALLDYFQITEFKTGKDVYTLRTGIDQMIKDAAKQQPIAS